MRVRTLEVDGDGDKSLVVFDDPGDVAGTALLSFTHKAGSDDQWLYLPALRRITSYNVCYTKLLRCCPPAAPTAVCATASTWCSTISPASPGNT